MTCRILNENNTQKVFFEAYANNGTVLNHINVTSGFGHLAVNNTYIRRSPVLSFAVVSNDPAQTVA